MVLIWELTESNSDLVKMLPNARNYGTEFDAIRTDKRRREYLGVRVALNALLDREVQVVYDGNGKPHLLDNSYQISISHSGRWIAVMADKKRVTGIDIEIPSDKVQRVFTRFLSKIEQNEISDRGRNIEKLQIAWSAKEAVYKIIGKDAVDFASQIRIHPFVVKEKGKVIAEHLPSGSFLQLNYIRNSEYTMVFGSPKKQQSMKQSIFRKILFNREANKKLLAVLLDPDQCQGMALAGTVSALKTHTPDLIFVGGSHTLQSTDALVELLKEEIKADIVLFPGNASQFSPKADALLYLSLISGRNAEFLIGQHVNSSISIKNANLEVIPTGYILVDGGKASSVEYMSNTNPIPREKKAIALSTAIAGELLGMRLIYLEAGSGAELPVKPDMIEAVSQKLSIPLIVGGGLKTTVDVKNAFDAGADIVVIGSAIESDISKIEEMVCFTKAYNEANEVIF